MQTSMSQLYLVQYTVRLSLVEINSIQQNHNLTQVNQRRPLGLMIKYLLRWFCFSQSVTLPTHWNKGFTFKKKWWLYVRLSKSLYILIFWWFFLKSYIIHIIHSRCLVNMPCTVICQTAGSKSRKLSWWISFVL